MVRGLSAGLAIAALASTQAAHAQKACVDPNDLNEAIIYMMPIAYDAAIRACGPKFAPDAFMRTNGVAFINQFRERQDETWQGTVRFVETFSENPRGLGGVFRGLPDENLRAPFDQEIGDKIEEAIKLDVCQEIERGMELIEPLPVDNVSGIVTFLAEIAGVDNPPICSAIPSKKTTRK